MPREYCHTADPSLSAQMLYTANPTQKNRYAEGTARSVEDCPAQGFNIAETPNICGRSKIELDGIKLCH